MAGSNIRAGGAYVEIFAKDGSFQKSLRSIKNQLQTFGTGIKTLGAGALAGGLGLVAPLALATKSFADAGSAVYDMAARTGLGTDTIQELAFAAKQSGTDIESLEKGLRKLQQSAKSAGIDPDELIGKAADEMAAMTDHAERVAFAVKTFGKAGASLIPLLSQGSGAIAEMREQARLLGLVMSIEDVEAADELGDSLDALLSMLGGVKNTVGAALAPAITALAKTMTDTAAGVRAFVSANRGLIQAALLGGAILTSLGGVLLATGIALQVASYAVGGFAVAWAAVGSTLAFVASSPLLLVLAGVIAIGAALPAVQEAAVGVFGMLSEVFTQLGTIATETFAAISQALIQGDIAAAADVLWAGLKLAWLTGTSEIRRIWRETTNDIASFGIDAFASFQSAISLTATFMQDAFAATFNGIAAAWTGTQNVIAGGMARAIAAMTGQDANEVLATLQEDQDRAANAQKNSIAAAQNERDIASKKRLEQIEAERTAMQASLGEELKGQQTAAENELKAAREALIVKTEAIEAAKNGFKNFGLAEPDEVKKAVGGSLSLGSFGGRNIQGIGGIGDIKQPITETAENTAEIAELLRNNEGLAFG